MKKYKNCQSCGMPLKKDPKKKLTTGTSSSNKYCSYCFEDGEFKQPGISAEEMQAFVKTKLKEMNFPGFIAKFYTKGIPKLERWKNQ